MFHGVCMRWFFWAFCVFYVCLFAVLAIVQPTYIWVPLLGLPIVFLGLYDSLQTKHTILKNFPLLGRCRYLLERFRPEIQQYFIETNRDGLPFSREKRSIVYQRSKMALDSLPFGTQMDVYKVGYEWLNHSICPLHFDEDIDLRTSIGEHSDAKP